MNFVALYNFLFLSYFRDFFIVLISNRIHVGISILKWIWSKIEINLIRKTWNLNLKSEVLLMVIRLDLNKIKANHIFEEET